MLPCAASWKNSRRKSDRLADHIPARLDGPLIRLAGSVSGRRHYAGLPLRGWDGPFGPARSPARARSRSKWIAKTGRTLHPARCFSYTVLCAKDFLPTKYCKGCTPGCLAGRHVRGRLFDLGKYSGAVENANEGEFVSGEVYRLPHARWPSRSLIGIGKSIL